METETKTQRISWATRETCTVDTYDAWLKPSALTVFEKTALGVLVDHGGTWTVGSDTLVDGGNRLNPRECLRRLVRFGFATQTALDTWKVTTAGVALDRGRPHPAWWVSAS